MRGGLISSFLLTAPVAHAQWTGVNPVLTTQAAANVGIGLAAGTTPSARLQIHNGDLHLTSPNNSGLRTISTNSPTSILTLTTQGANGINPGPSIDIYGTSNTWRQGNMYFHSRATANAPSYGSCFTFLNADAGNNWMTLMSLQQRNGMAKVTIGDANIVGDYGLYVAGGILTEKLRVALRNTQAWADYVFDKDYALLPLDSVQRFISQNKHLPGIPSAAQVAKEGIDTGEMTAKLLAKIEELTLYVLQQQAQIRQLQQKSATPE